MHGDDDDFSIHTWVCVNVHMNMRVRLRNSLFELNWAVRANFTTDLEMATTNQPTSVRSYMKLDLLLVERGNFYPVAVAAVVDVAVCWCRCLALYQMFLRSNSVLPFRVEQRAWISNWRAEAWQSTAKAAFKTCAKIDFKPRPPEEQLD